MRLLIALLPTLFLLTAAHVQQYEYAGQPNELYQAEVCNQGRIAVDVAVAYRDFGFNDEFWIVDYWYRAEPGKCKLVYSHFYASQRMVPHKASRFMLLLLSPTGAASGVPPKSNRLAGVTWSRLKLCVERGNNKYRVDTKDPGVKCPKGILIPAAIVWESTRGVYPNAYSRQYPPPKRFTVALGPNDRAIAVGPQGSSAPATQGPGVLKDMSAIIRDAVNGPGAPKPNISARNYAVKNLWLQVCASTPVVKKASWSDPQSARARALKAALRQFIASHRFRDADAADGPAGSVRPDDPRYGRRC